MIRLRSLPVLSFALSGALFAPTAGTPALADSPAAAPAASPVAVAQRLCDALLEAMKQGKALGYEGRFKLLSPEIARDLDLAFMTRIVVGPRWETLTPAERNQLVEAFSAYSEATYASQFSGYSGERFEVDPAATPMAHGNVLVRTQLIPAGADPVHLDYMMRRTGSDWRIIDVFLSGTISEMAARRSEYSSILRDGGAPALISLLRKKTEEEAH